MSQNKKLPAPLKRDIQKTVVLIALANLILFFGIGAIFFHAFSAAAIGSWGLAAFQFAFGTLILWLYLPHIALNCIELYVISTRLDRDYAKLDALVSKTLRIFKVLRMQKSLTISALLIRLGQARVYQGFFESAENLFKESISCANAVPGSATSINLAMSVLNLGSAYAWQSKYVESEVEAERALEILQKSHQPQAKQFEPHCVLLIGINRVRLNELDSAGEYLQSACETFEKMNASQEMPLLAIQTAKISCYLYLAILKIKQNDAAKSYEYYNKFFKLIQGSSTVVSTTHIRSLNTLADEYVALGDYKHAEDLVNISYELSSAAPFHPDSQATLATYERLLVATDRKAEIADMRSFLRPIPQIASLHYD